MNMHIGLVARCLNTPHIRGMGRYVFELLRQSAADASIRWRVLGDDPRHPLQLPPGARAEGDVFAFRGDRFQLWEQLGLPQRARRANVDLLHCTEGSLPWWQPVPTVVTLHDTLAWAERESTATARVYFDRLLPAALSRCAAIITDSQSSGRDIVAKWPALEPKLTVIPLGIGDDFLANDAPAEAGELQRRHGAAPYVVYLGGPIVRKRFTWALKVLESVGRPDLHMVACGFGADAREAGEAAVPLALKGRVHLAPFLSDEQLVALYRGASAVMYPTLYEGFGFPAIEAQAAGVPVIFAPISSLAELVGPLALTAEAHDLSAWTQALQRALAMGPERQARAHEACLWAQRFSWRRTYEAHRVVYNHVLQSRRRSK